MTKLKPERIEKVYWTIGEVAIKLQEPESRVRFWVNDCKITVKIDSYGRNLIKKKEVEKITKMSELLKTEFYTVKGAYWFASIYVELKSKQKRTLSM